MESSDYFVAKSDKYTLIRRIGNRNISLVSDLNPTFINLIYQKICNKLYSSEKELFEDIYSHYSNLSIVPILTN